VAFYRYMDEMALQTSDHLTLRADSMHPEASQDAVSYPQNNTVPMVSAHDLGQLDFN
jgi:hypothetical protein